MVDIICYKITDSLWECKVTVYKKNPNDTEGVLGMLSDYVKFNEGQYKTKDECLSRCVEICNTKIKNGEMFRFQVCE